MLLFILKLTMPFPSFTTFQYISCYCLSSCRKVSEHYTAEFQYISCYCLSLIQNNDVIDDRIFQYISCYCLSTWGIVILCYLLNFNTSHVTVYLYGRRFSVSIAKFQYISCYCLSQEQQLYSSIKFDFNTSHVTVYHRHNAQILRTYLYFNTSHVTVYLFCFRLLQIIHHISIHLMLLFILATHPITPSVVIFQYISCYCLSCILSLIIFSAFIFQYISCYCLSNELTPFYIFLRI